MTKADGIGSPARRASRAAGRLALAALLSAPAVLPALAQDAKTPIKLQLNRLEPAGEACRTYLLVDNRGPALKSLKVDVFAFDGEGVAHGDLQGGGGGGGADLSGRLGRVVQEQAMDDVVARAATQAQPGDTVLLAPAAAVVSRL